MALAPDLLEHAETLARLDSRRPKQVNLRRATSAAYYALFHALIADAASVVSPASPPTLRIRVQRSFQHSEMKKVCQWVVQPTMPAPLQGLLPVPFSPAIHRIAHRFTRLQEARHLADYDPVAMQYRATTLEYIGMARHAVETLREVRGSDEANAFFAALAYAGRWSR